MRLIRTATWAIAIALGCGGVNPVSPDVTALPPGVDTADPFPIDRGDDGAHTPGSYKGLSLRLTANGTPTVTAVGGVILARVVGVYIPDVRIPGLVPITVAAAVLVTAAILASLMPAARASRIDVIQALRAE